MPQSPGKFCIDRNLVRWTLLDRTITRKTLQDAPTGGQELPVKQVKAIEKVIVKKVHRQPFGWPAVLFAVGVIALSWWSGALSIRLVGGLVGLACLFWGAKRIPARTTELEAYQIVAPNRKPEDWLMVGSTSEIIGFIDELKAQMAQEREAIGA